MFKKLLSIFKGRRDKIRLPGNKPKASAPEEFHFKFGFINLNGINPSLKTILLAVFFLLIVLAIIFLLRESISVLKVLLSM